MEIPNSGEQYNLKWNNHLANFIQTFIEHQNGESLVDVTLSCEGQYIKAHKLILSACSDYFHSIFKIHNVPHPFIFLNGVRFVDLKCILHFMYHGEVKVIDKDLPTVLALGETLQIKGLSSVKLRDVPPDNVQPVPLMQQKLPKKIPRHTKSNNASNSHFLLLQPNEVPYQIPNFSKKSIYINNPGESTDNNYTKIKRKKSCLSNGQSKRNIMPNGDYISKSDNKSEVASEGPPLSNKSGSDSESANKIETNSSHSEPLPPFMIFTNEWKKKLTLEHPEKSKKEIYVKLGNMWKNLTPEAKNVYYEAAKKGNYSLKHSSHTPANESIKRKSDVLNDSTNTTSVSIFFYTWLISQRIY